VTYSRFFYEVSLPLNMHSIEQSRYNKRLRSCLLRGSNENALRYRTFRPLNKRCYELTTWECLPPLFRHAYNLFVKLLKFFQGLMQFSGVCRKSQAYYLLCLLKVVILNPTSNPLETLWSEGPCCCTASTMRFMQDGYAHDIP
jgi:hypothetical protein